MTKEDLLNGNDTAKLFNVSVQYLSQLRNGKNKKNKLKSGEFKVYNVLPKIHENEHYCRVRGVIFYSQKTMSDYFNK